MNHKYIINNELLQKYINFLENVYKTKIKLYNYNYKYKYKYTHKNNLVYVNIIITYRNYKHEFGARSYNITKIYIPEISYYDLVKIITQKNIYIKFKDINKDIIDTIIYNYDMNIETMKYICIKDDKKFIKTFYYSKMFIQNLFCSKSIRYYKNNNLYSKYYTCYYIYNLIYISFSHIISKVYIINNIYKQFYNYKLLFINY